MDNLELERWRGLDAFQVMTLLCEHIKVDREFKPVRAKATQRVHISANGQDWELLIEGPKFYDTRSRVGGGGGVDLVMHLWGVPFKKAVTMLRQAGV